MTSRTPHPEELSAVIRFRSLAESLRYLAAELEVVARRLGARPERATVAGVALCLLDMADEADAGG